VSAPGGLGGHRFSRKAQDRLFQRLLHAQPVGLPLPAAERGAVIFDNELETGHQAVLAGRGPAPRRKVAASIAPLPSRCTCTSRTAPVPQAMVRPSPSKAPGSPDPPTRAERNALIRSVLPPSSSSNQPPGKGDRPRMRLCTCSALCEKSIRASALSILAA